MEPNPKTFPILSYVMSRLNSISRPSQSGGAYADHDIEQPQIQDRSSPRSPHFSVELVERMPHLADPFVIAAMKSAVFEVAQTRSVLQALGDRPDNETVDLVKAHIVKIDRDLSRTLEEIACTPRPAEVDVRSWQEKQADKEEECRAKAEREKVPYKAVIQLDEMHEAYEKLLKDAEEKLLRIYDGHDHHREGKEVVVGEESVEEQANEEVIGILQEASAKSVERVELSGRQLRFLPEAFGRVRGLVSIDVSNNRLEVIPDSIAGLENLEELRVSSNLLVSLPDSIGLLLNLKILDVSGNKLKALPDSISKCRSLVELDASYNDLTYLPTNIGYEFVNLQKLCVHLNKLRSLPTSICEMSSLRFLDAHFNELHGVPYAIGKLSNLESLNLSSNFSDLKELPPTFGDLINLMELDLSNNQIHALPDTFGRLEKLTKLNLEQNPLYVPPMEVVNQGVEAVKEYMAKRWLDILLEEQQKNQLQESPTKAGWLTRSSSLLGSLVTGFTEYLGVGDKSPRDPVLDQNL